MITYTIFFFFGVPYYNFSIIYPKCVQALSKPGRFALTVASGNIPKKTDPSAYRLQFNATCEGTDGSL